LGRGLNASTKLYSTVSICDRRGKERESLRTAGRKTEKNETLTFISSNCQEKKKGDAGEEGTQAQEREQP